MGSLSVFRGDDGGGDSKSLRTFSLKASRTISRHQHKLKRDHNICLATKIKVDEAIVVTFFYYIDVKYGYSIRARLNGQFYSISTALFITDTHFLEALSLGHLGSVVRHKSWLLLGYENTVKTCLKTCKINMKT